MITRDINSIKFYDRFGCSTLSFCYQNETNRIERTSFNIFPRDKLNAFSLKLAAPPSPINSLRGAFSVENLKKFHVATRLLRSPIERESRRHRGGAPRIESTRFFAASRRERERESEEKERREEPNCFALPLNVPWPARFHALRRP